MRLGTEYVGNLSDPGSKARAPRVQNIWAKRGDFQDAVAKLPWLHHAQVQVEDQGKAEEGPVGRNRSATIRKETETIGC